MTESSFVYSQPNRLVQLLLKAFGTVSKAYSLYPLVFGVFSPGGVLTYSDICADFCYL